MGGARNATAFQPSIIPAFQRAGAADRSGRAQQVLDGPGLDQRLPSITGFDGSGRDPFPKAKRHT